MECNKKLAWRPRNCVSEEKRNWRHYQFFLFSVEQENRTNTSEELFAERWWPLPAANNTAEDWMVVRWRLLICETRFFKSEIAFYIMMTPLW